MKQTLVQILALSLGLFWLTSCRAEVSESAVTEALPDTTVVVTQTEPVETAEPISCTMEFHYAESVGMTDAILMSPLIVRGTVTEIGDARLIDGYEIRASLRQEQLSDAAQQIYTPLTFSVEEILCGDTLAAVGDVMDVLWHGGTYIAPDITVYALHTNEHDRTHRQHPDADTEYLLFLSHTSPTGVTDEDAWYILPQNSVVLYEDGTYDNLARGGGTVRYEDQPADVQPYLLNLTRELQKAAEYQPMSSMKLLVPFDSDVAAEPFLSFQTLFDTIESGVTAGEQTVLHIPKSTDRFVSLPLDSIYRYEDGLYTAVFCEPFNAHYAMFTRYDTEDRMRTYLECDVLPYVTEDGIAAIADAVITDRMEFDTGYGIGVEITYDTAEHQNLRAIYAEASVDGVNAVYTRRVEDGEYLHELFASWTDADGRTWHYAVQTNVPWYGMGNFSNMVFQPDQFYPPQQQTEPDFRDPPGIITWDTRYYQSMDELLDAMASDTVLADSLGDVYTLSGLPPEYEMHGIEHVIGDDSYTFSYAAEHDSEAMVAMTKFPSAYALEANLLYLLDTDGTPDGLRRNDNLSNLRVSEEETPWGTMQVTVYDTSVKNDLKTTYLDFTDENGIRRVLIRRYYEDGTQRDCRLYVFDRTCPMLLLFSAPLDNELLFSLTAKPIS